MSCQAVSPETWMAWPDNHVYVSVLTFSTTSGGESPWDFKGDAGSSLPCLYLKVTKTNLVIYCLQEDYLKT